VCGLVRYDAKEANPYGGAAGFGWDKLTGQGIKETMTKAGLGARCVCVCVCVCVCASSLRCVCVRVVCRWCREGALLFGAVGAVHMSVKDTGLE
jgi:hypothetical protein